jgi:hypothetical protein
MRNNGRTLKDFYEAMIKEKLDLEEDDASANKNSNKISLTLTITSSIELLAEQSPAARDLLFFLSLLPNGMTLSQLQSMWSQDVQKLIDAINIYEFFD